MNSCGATKYNELNTIVSKHLQSINTSLNNIYKTLAPELPADKRKALEETILQAIIDTTQFQEQIKNILW